MEKYNIDFFIKNIESLDINLNEEQYKQFIIYYELLVEWNKDINLTAITEFKEVVVKHFVDSLTLIKCIDLNKDFQLIDIGTGAGFPGIPLKIAFPHLNVTLLDSLNKRINFLNEVINTLSLESIKVYHGRAEDYAKYPEFRETFDLAVSRAVANLSTLTEYCLPFVKTDGIFISYKSDKLVDELTAAKNGIQLLGGKIENQIEFILPGSDHYRNLLIIKKIKNTPNKYPRRAGLPSKEPLR